MQLLSRCILNGTAVTYFRCRGQEQNHLREISSVVYHKSFTPVIREIQGEPVFAAERRRLLPLSTDIFFRCRYGSKGGCYGREGQTDGRTDGRPTITQTLFRTLLAIGATTAEKLERTSRVVGADPLPSPPVPFPSPINASPQFHPFLFLLFFPSPLNSVKRSMEALQASHNAQRQTAASCKSCRGRYDTIRDAILTCARKPT